MAAFMGFGRTFLQRKLEFSIGPGIRLSGMCGDARGNERQRTLTTARHGRQGRLRLPEPPQRHPLQEKQRSRTKARMDARTRERLPVMPALAAVDRDARTPSPGWIPLAPPRPVPCSPADGQLPVRPVPLKPFRGRAGKFGGYGPTLKLKNATIQGALYDACDQPAHATGEWPENGHV